MKFLFYFLLLVTPPALADQAAGRSPQSGGEPTGALLAGDADFLAAHNAYLGGDTAKLERYAQRLKDSPLQVYAHYYQLSLALKKAGTKPLPDSLQTAVENFLALPQDTPVFDLLRSEWLNVLGEKQQWGLFDLEYPHLREEDTELTCYALQSRLRTLPQEALGEARKLWFSDEQQPASCGILFDAALTADIISSQDVEQRLLLALEGNNVSLAGDLSKLLDDQYAGLPGMLKSAVADPDRFLRKLMPDVSLPAEPLLAAVSDKQIEAPGIAAASGIEQYTTTDSPQSSPIAVNASPPVGLPAWKTLMSLLGLDRAAVASPVATIEAPSPPAGFGPECGAACTLISDDDSAPPSGWDPKLSHKGQRVAAMFALERLAKQSTDLAAARWDKLAGFFPEKQQHYMYARLAFQAARNLDGRALQWYRAAEDTPLSEVQSAWLVRAALREQDWPAVLAGVNAMGQSQQQESAWLYWKGRALQALGKPAEARAIFAPLSGEYSFYGQLAGEELTDTPVLSETAPAYKPDQQTIDAVSLMPGVQRTLALYRFGMRSEALEEWRWVVNNLNDQDLLAAAEIALRNKMYDRAIGAADMTVNTHDFSMRYLAPYRDDLQAHIHEQDLDEAWVYGLMRQESRFARNAKSGAGAAGLMQVMPATARWVAKKLGMKRYRKELIHQLDTNLRIGTYYMKSVLTRAENNPVLASAAYNAGPMRALQWRGDKPLEGAIYAETIPYQETRDYVEKVMSNTAYYANQFGDPPQSLKQRLGIIAAKIPDIQAANANGK